MENINFKEIEKKWQEKWEEAKIFETNVDENKPKFFITVPYPYVNGAPHIGAGFTFTRGDVYARFKRMQGFNVLFPQGFHATGEPILGAIERLKKNDKTQIETFKLFGASDKDIEDFKTKGAEYTAKYWMKKWIEILKLAGFSIDWRRTFITAITPHYSKFIEWQYNTLKKLGYVIQGTHPVIWCPYCQSPTGDHDRLEGEGESVIDYIILKFKLESGEILPCGTLRPETIYGVTNIWVNPEVEYLKAKVNGEIWILSERATIKLKDQLKKIEVVGKIKGEELIGKYAENPITKEKIIVFPANFVDPDSATGIVMSVPSHAPYDWIALKELKENPEKLKKYGIEEEIIKKIEPVSIIKTPEFGEHPAIEICEKMEIKSLKQKEKLEKATSILYKKEFHQGILKENCGKYKNLKVSECKEKLSKNFIEEKIADIIWETTGKVVCRCGTLNHVKILENQWFLKYSDEKWKERVRECIKRIKFYPEEVKKQFENTVEWLKDKACTRKTGLGTPLPWDKEWIVETLSDSTIYMAYYTISRMIKDIPAEKLSDEVFDFIFLGKGSSKELSKKFEIDEKLLEEIRREFEYFYPVDLRTSGKDLVQHHLTFFIFHHVAIWDNPKYWPKAIGVNGYVNISGVKMSKSKGNVIPFFDLIKEYGADLTRINIVASNEGLKDADWREENIISYETRFRFINQIIESLSKAKRKKLNNLDIYLQSKLQERIKKATENYEEMKFRSAVQVSLFDLTNDIKWYVERLNGIENCNRSVLKEVLENLIKLIAPVVPHISEEFWEKMGHNNFVSLEKWPEFKEELIKKEILELEEIFKNTLEDLKNVIKIAGRKKSAYLYVVTDKEFEHFKNAEEFLKKYFGFEKVLVFKSSDEKKYDPEKKASRAKYGKPGIYLE